MKDPIEDQVIGDYRFHWLNETSAVCYCGADTYEHCNMTVLFTLIHNDNLDAQHLEFRYIGSEWLIQIPKGKYRSVALVAEPNERDQLILALKAITEYKELGYGEGLAW